MNGLPCLHVVLVQPEIPQNTGNIARTCVAVGARLWLVRPLGFRLDDHHLRRSGLDYWEHLDWQAVDSWGDLESLLGPGHRWYFTRHARRLHYQATFSQGDVLIFGGETKGLPRSILGDPEQASALRIPMASQVRSLNLSNAVAVAAYEAIRQWSPGP